jgi:hypothetical protein
MTEDKGSREHSAMSRERREETFIRRVREILLEKWDPICIGDNPNLKDEYDGYLGHLISILKDPSVTRLHVVEYLMSVEVGEMGLPGDSVRQSVVADALLELVRKT